jgi:hypothetical protein
MTKSRSLLMIAGALLVLLATLTAVQLYVSAGAPPSRVGATSDSEHPLAAGRPPPFISKVESILQRSLVSSQLSNEDLSLLLAATHDTRMNHSARNDACEVIIASGDTASIHALIDKLLPQLEELPQSHTWRDYSIQHLAAATRVVTREDATTALESIRNDPEDADRGTAWIAEADFLEAAEVAELRAVLGNQRSPLEHRITAASLLGDHSDSQDLLRDHLFHSSNHRLVRLACIGSLARLLHGEEMAVLMKRILSDTHDSILAEAARHHLKRNNRQ